MPSDSFLSLQSVDLPHPILPGFHSHMNQLLKLYLPSQCLWHRHAHTCAHTCAHTRMHTHPCWFYVSGEPWLIQQPTKTISKYQVVERRHSSWNSHLFLVGIQSGSAIWDSSLAVSCSYIYIFIPCPSHPSPRCLTSQMLTGIEKPVYECMRVYSGFICCP